MHRALFTWCHLYNVTHSQPLIFCIHEWRRRREGGRKRGRSAPNALQPHLSPSLFSSPVLLPIFTLFLPLSSSSSPAPPPLLHLPVFSGTSQFHSLRKLSQDPVQTPIPSAGTPVQLTLLSWPDSTPGGGEERGGYLSGREWKERKEGRGDRMQREGKEKDRKRKERKWEDSSGEERKQMRWNEEGRKGKERR